MRKGQGLQNAQSKLSEVALNQFHFVTIWVGDEGNDSGAAFDRASFTRHFATGIANFFSGCIGIWHGNGQVTVGGTHVIRLNAPVEGEFKFCVVGVAAVTHKSQ